MKNEKEFFDKPYMDRQIIIFVKNEIFTAEQTVSEKIDDKKKVNIDWGSLILKSLLVSPLTLLLEKQIINIYEKAKKNDINIQMVPKKWIPSFSLPPGHPRDKVLYIAHPVENNVYIPVADFHRSIFEQKFSEVLSILMHLGAKEIFVEHKQGWGHEFSGKLSAGIPEADVELEGSIKNKSATSRALLYEAKLEGTDSPSLPDKLVWYHHEPTWQKVAEGRLNFGLKKFSLQFQYQDDYSVNAGLKIKAEKAGLDLGGEFQDYKSTIWSIKGSF